MVEDAHNRLEFRDARYVEGLVALNLGIELLKHNNDEQAYSRKVPCRKWHFLIVLYESLLCGPRGRSDATDTGNGSLVMNLTVCKLEFNKPCFCIIPATRRSRTAP